MEDFQSGEETTFVVDEVSNIIKEAIESAIGGSAYQHNKVNPWTSNVVEQCLNQLAKLAKPFKYIVTCVIMQKNGAGLHTASSCFWDNTTDEIIKETEYKDKLFHGLALPRLMASLDLNYSDPDVAKQCKWPGSCTVRWENKTMYCIVSVFGLAI